MQDTERAFQFKNEIWKIHPLDSILPHLGIHFLRAWLKNECCTGWNLCKTGVIFIIPLRNSPRKQGFSSSFCHQEDVMSQICLLPTDWSFVKDVLCCYWLLDFTCNAPEASTTAGLSDNRALIPACLTSLSLLPHSPLAQGRIFLELTSLFV